MITAVLDANVLASGSVNATGPSGQALDAWRARRVGLVVSEHILAELARTHQKPYFRARLSPEQIQTFQSLLRIEATITPITAQVHGVATHPEDDVDLATAVSATADYLVTGDKKLQDLGTHEGITIVSPRAFLTVLRSQEG